jgi:capsular exopolysaccharide synthesis family protein
MATRTSRILNPKSKSPIAEAYKTLRTNLQFASLDKPTQVVVITSANPSEGKTTTAANLAISVAQAEKRVLLLDCDLRKPSIHRFFGIVNAKGLTNILVENINYHELSVTTGIPNLHIITSGPKPPNPSELLGSSRMASFVNQLRQDYDMIVIDSPPVLPVTDSAVLSRVSDAHILVVGCGTTTVDMAVHAKDSLDKVGARIIGTVINNIPTRGSGFSYYYYYYYDIQSDETRGWRTNDHDEDVTATLNV